MAKELFEIYDGNEPYLFISYSHADEDVVFPLIAGIQKAGYRVWMDRGIEVGTEWSDNIADHLTRCEAVIFFVSKKSVASENCLDEIATAKSKKKPAILIFIEEDVQLPPGVEMQTNRFQRMPLYRYDSVDQMVKALIEAPMLKPCYVEPVVESVAEPAVEPVVEPVVESVVEPVVESVVEPVVAPAVAPVEEKTAAATRFCPQCGAAVPTTGKFCNSCGCSLQEGASAPAASAKTGGFMDKLRALPKKTKMILGAVAVVAVLGILVGLLVPLFTADESPQIASAYDVSVAFKNAGYTVTVDQEGSQLDTSGVDYITEAVLYEGHRMVQDVYDENVNILYITCTDAENAAELYGMLLPELSGNYEEVIYGENWKRATYDDASGTTEILSWHDNVVVLVEVDYSEVAYAIYWHHIGVEPYDYLPGTVLESVKF